MSGDGQYPESASGWADVLAEALRLVIDREDENPAPAVEALDAYDAWKQAQQPPRVRIRSGHVGVLVDVYTTPHGDYAIVQVDDVMYDVPLDEVEHE